MAHYSGGDSGGSIVFRGGVFGGKIGGGATWRKNLGGFARCQGARSWQWQRAGAQNMPTLSGKGDETLWGIQETGQGLEGRFSKKNHTADCVEGLALQ